MSKYLCRFVLALMTAGAVAQSSPKPADPKPDYSKEAFVDEEDLATISFENNGTGTRETTLRLRIQSDAGVQRYSVLSFAYQEAIETIEIVYVRVRKPDGALIVTPAENVLDMPSEITRQAPFYSDLHEKHVAVKGLTVGDVLESQVRWKVTKPLAPGQFWFAYNRPHDFILLHQELQISIPRDRPVKWKSPVSKPVITEAAGRRIFTWTFSQLEHPSSDQDKADQEEKAYQAARGKLPPPDIELSSFQTWQEIGAWYGGLQQERVKPSPAIQAKAAELTKNAADDNAKLHAIYNYVSTQFRYIGVAFGIGRYQPHSADDVLANQYGDCKDKHTLLASLLDAAGIQAYPALINSSRDLDPDVPSPQQFDHVITAVPQGKDFLWLDTTAEVAPFGQIISPLLQKEALVIISDQPARLVSTPTTLPVKSRRTFTLVGKLDDSGTLNGKVEQSIQGSDAEIVVRRGFRTTPSQQWKDLVQQFSYALGFSGEVSDVSASPPDKTDEPWHVSYIYKRKDYPDWAHQRISPPTPLLALPIADEDRKPKTPIWLGPPTEIVGRSEVELPAGYSPVLPPTIDAKEDFAEYHAEYSFKDGRLVTERRLTIKSSQVTPKEYDAYQYFKRRVDDDRGRYLDASTGNAKFAPNRTGWAAIADETRELPLCENPDARSAETASREAALRGDPEATVESLKRAVEIDPKCTRDWMTLGGLQTSMGKRQEALESFRKALEANPNQVLILRAEAYTLGALKKYDEASDAWKQLLKIAPEDSDAISILPRVLTTLKRYSEAATAYESAVKLQPDNAFLRVYLGSAYLHAGDEKKALEAYNRALELDPGPRVRNDVGYELADTNHQLPLALEYTERSVREQEELSANIKLDGLALTDLGPTDSVASNWDSLGWTYFRLGKYSKAETYLRAAWIASQHGDNADHLGQIYENLNKKEEAAHMYRLALASRAHPSDPDKTKARLDSLGKIDPGTEDEARTELTNARTFPMETVTGESSAAEFFVLIGPGSKVEDVKFISGSEKLKDADSALRKIKFNFLYPDDGPTRFVRRGILSCSSARGCSFTLYHPMDVNSVN